MATVLRRKQDQGAPPLASAGTPASHGDSFSVAPPKLRRRPPMVAGAVALTCAGAVAGTWTYLGVSDAQPVVAMRVAVQRGEVIERSDLVTARISVDPVLDPVPSPEGLALVGQRAAVDLPAGGIVTRGAVTPSMVPAAGDSVVGLGLTPGLLPGGQLRPGDRVRVVGVPAKGVAAAEAETLMVAAEVAAVQTSSTSNTIVVDVVVPEGDAARVAAAAAAGEVALVLDSRER